MPLSNIIDKIMADSKSEADSIIEEANRLAEEIISKGKKQAELEKEKKIEDARKRFETDKLRKIALTKLDARKKILKARCNLLDEAFSRAKSKIGKIRTDSMRNLIQKALAGFKPKIACEVIVHEPDRDKFTLLLSTLWGAAFSRYCRVSTVDKSIGGGFFLRSGNVEYDCTFNRLVSERRLSLEKDVAAILFTSQ
jgi:V/A-type H+/Na+-transporting ATPase subunit E